MSRTLMFILFFSIGTIVVSLVHFYIWSRLIRDTAFPGGIKSTATYVVILLAVSFPVSVGIARLFPLKISYPILWVAFLWLGMMMLFFFMLLFLDLVKLLVYLAGKLFAGGTEAVDPERRVFLSRILAAGASTVVIGAAGVGVIKYYARPVVRRIDLKLKGLPAVFDGFRIIQISDLHIGQMMTRETLAELVQQVNDLKGDLVAITGDLIDGTTEKLRGCVDPLASLQARDGVFFVTGNHEYYSGVDDWMQKLGTMGIQWLDNRHVKINRGDEFFYLAGVNDHQGKRFGPDHAADFQKALGGLEPDRKTILLAHHPLAVREAAKYQPDIVLSGHTHGGQIFPFNLLVHFDHPYIKGFYTHQGTRVYVNQGTGCWGPPMRLGTENEITVFRLTAV